MTTGILNHLRIRARFAFLVLLLPWQFVTAAEAQDDAKTVSVQKLSNLAISIQRSAPATVVSLNNSQIASEISARILEITVLVGDTVQPGDVLARLNCNDYQRNITQSQAQLSALNARRKLASQQLQRFQKLVNSRNVSEDQVNQKQSELDVVNAEILAQRSALNIAKDQSLKCEVKSPFRGVVTERLGQVGGFATPGTELVTLVDLDAIELSADVPVGIVGELSSNNVLDFKHANQVYRLLDPRVVKVIDNRTRTQTVRARFEKDHPPVGASGRLNWTAPLPAIPADLLVQRGGRLGVMLASNERAIFHPLSNALEGRPSLTQLPQDSLIITAGRQLVVDGDAVNITDSN